MRTMWRIWVDMRKSGARPDWLGWEALETLWWHAGLRLKPAVSGMLNWLAQEILSRPSSSWLFVPSPPISVILIPLISPVLILNSTITWEHKVQPSLSISPCDDQELTLSTAYTEYSIHPSTAYTEYCIHCVLHHPNSNCLPHPASLSSLSTPCCTQFYTFPQLRVDQWIESQLLSRLPPKLPPVDWPPPCTPPISLDHGLQVHIQTSSITASKCISKLAQSQPPSVFPNSHDYGHQVYLQTHTITAFKCISKLARSWCGDMVELKGSQPIINIQPHLAWHPKGFLDKAWF